jgi:hypothetical protein
VYVLLFYNGISIVSTTAHSDDDDEQWLFVETLNSPPRVRYDDSGAVHKKKHDNYTIGTVLF